MSPAWTRFVRRNWQVLVAIAVFAVFSGVHAIAFRPALARYRRAADQATRLGIPLGTTNPIPAPSARVVSLLARNSLVPAAAEEQGASGALTAGLLADVTRLAARNGLQVLSTEQGLVTQLPGSVLVRAHFQLSGGYGRFVALLDDIARTGTLITLDRFTVNAPEASGANIEIWVSRLVLKRTGAPR
jgi:hypothetical protein